jgi:chemotaxis protein MotB
VGLSSSVLFDKDNSRNPINRRISIIVMTKEADESALKTDAMPESAAMPASAAPDAPAEAPAGTPASAAVNPNRG